MATNHYALETNGKNRFDISWKGIIYKGDQITVSLDGNPIGVICDKEAFLAGQEFSLPDGSTIRVQLVKKIGIQVQRNGQLLYDSVLQPQAQPKSAAQLKTAYELAYGIIYFIGGLNFVLGLVTIFFNVEFLRQVGINYISIIYGLVFLILGFFVQRKSISALILAIIIYGLDGFVSLLLTISQGNFLAIGVLISRIIFITPMIQGIHAMKAFNQKKE